MLQLQKLIKNKMKRIHIAKQAWALMASLIIGMNLFAQDSTAAANELTIALRYFMFNNKIPYVTVNTKTKVDGKFKPAGNISLQVYLDSVAPANLLGKVTTNDRGESYILIPATLKTTWDAMATHKFFAVSEENKQFPESTTDIEITKAKVSVDTTTVDSVRSITAKVYELKDNEWVAVPDVEMKIGIRRLGSALSVGKEETYTTDSTGEVTAEFARQNIPAENGIITLVVNVEDNDKYGNLVFEEKLPWGTTIQQANDWDKRTLWSTRSRTPVWLLFMAYSIMAAVWGVLIYLVIQIIKIRKIGRSVNLGV
jgi:hypothetical protein